MTDMRKLMESVAPLFESNDNPDYEKFVIHTNPGLWNANAGVELLGGWFDDPEDEDMFAINYHLLAAGPEKIADYLEKHHINAPEDIEYEIDPNDIRKHEEINDQVEKLVTLGVIPQEMVAQQRLGFDEAELRKLAGL